MLMSSQLLIRSLAALILSCTAPWLQASEWQSYGGDPGSSKYSPLDQIHAGNVDQLAVAWVWESPDNALVVTDRKRTTFGFKSTPIMVDGTLFVSTSLGQVAALDGASGAAKWVFDTRSYEAGRPTNLGFNHRGVSFWSQEGKSRILMPTNDARL